MTNEPAPPSRTLNLIFPGLLQHVHNSLSVSLSCAVLMQQLVPPPAQTKLLLTGSQCFGCQVDLAELFVKRQHTMILSARSGAQAHCSNICVMPFDPKVNLKFRHNKNTTQSGQEQLRVSKANPGMWQLTGDAGSLGTPLGQWPDARH